MLSSTPFPFCLFLGFFRRSFDSFLSRSLGNFLDGRFFFAKVKDSVRLRLRADRYRNDVSLRGEFVRRVYGDTTLSDEDKERVLSFGLRALEGEMPEDISY